MNHLIPAVSDTKRPGDGFYSFVNEKWLTTHHVAPWQAEFGVSDEMTKETDKELLEILHSLPDLKNTNLTPKTPKEHIQLLGYIWKNREVKNEEAYIQVCLHSLMEFKGVQDISQFFGWLVRSSVPTFLEIGAREELQPPYKVRATLGTGRLVLPIEYYTTPKLQTSEVWSAYERFISICSIELGLPFLHKAIEAEKKAAGPMDSSYRHIAQTKSGHSIVSWVSDFDWTGFMDGLNLDNHWKTRIWLINEPERLKSVLGWICSVDEESIISALSLHILCVAAPYMRVAIREAHEDLVLRALRGIQRKQPKEEQMLNTIKDVLPDALCSVYSEHHSNRHVVTKVKAFIEDLKDSALDVMTYTTMFSKRTKSKVKEKLHRMWFEIGNGKLSKVPSVEYSPECFLHTMFSVHGARTEMLRELTGKPADTLRSSYPCFITNASYFEESNHIMIPWGILQWPFYCTNAPLGWNHGGIGATICHEMVHGFDLEGSQYSPRGVYKEWWTRKNRQTFRKKTRKVARFFSKFKHYGQAVDGKKTLSENWADFGGLTIAMDCLKKDIAKLQLTEKASNEAYRNFFISYAVSWRTLMRKEAILLSLKHCVHATGEDRIDRIVCQFQEWVDVFDIKKDDHLYLEPKDRLKFF